MNPLTLIGFGTNLAILWMVLAWFFARSRNNASWVDVAWTYAFIPVTLLATFLASTPPPRTLLLIGCVGLWSVRLGTHLAIRVAAHEPSEDPRYAALRERFPKRPWFMFFAVFMVQAVLVGILALPFYTAALNRSPTPGATEWLGVVVVLIGLIGESVADAQLRAFQKKSAGKKAVCDIGLWKHSRHPNYFFEWVIWIGFALIGLAGPYGWSGFLAPMIMYWLLTRVTGIPPAEEGSLKSRGDAYRRYQSRTSPFFPLPKR